MVTFEVNEKTSALYTACLVDEGGAVVSSGILGSATLTLYDALTGTIINSRNAQNVLNANNVTIDANGTLAWSLTPADSPIVTAGQRVERHIALFQFLWAGNAKGLNHEVLIVVLDLDKVT